MDENPEGTPNPLNPVEGVTEEPRPDTGMTTDTGELDFIETEETTITAGDSPLGIVTDMPAKAPAKADTPAETPKPMEVQSFSAVDQYVAARPASFAEPVARPASMSDAASANTAPTSTTMPRMATAAPRPARPSHPVIDPMMRPVTRPNPAASSVPSRAETRPAENNFDTFAMDSEPKDRLVEDIEQVSISDGLVAADSVVEPAKRNNKKRGLIIGAIVLIIIAIICASAAIAIFMLSGNDRVAKAIDKMLNGQMSSIVEARGTITSTSEPTDAETVIAGATSSTNLDFDIIQDMASSMNKLDASMTSTYENGTEITLDVNGLTNKDGETFFRVSGLKDILGTLNTVNVSSTSEVVDASTINFATTFYAKLIDKIDGQWILTSGGFGDISNSLDLVDNTSFCIGEAIQSLPKYGKDFANKYRANSFITSSKDNLAIKSKKNELYRIGYNKEKMNAFMKSVSGNGLVKAINECSSTDNEETGSTLFEEIFANFPTVYVEVDSNNNITRIYFTTTVEAGGISTNTKADIDLSYPSKLEIIEPSDYIESSNITLNLSSM